MSGVAPGHGGLQIRAGPIREAQGFPRSHRININGNGRPNNYQAVIAKRRGIWLLEMCGRWLVHRRLPLALALGAILVMLPALPLGLVLDDLPQRSVELRPDQLPARMDASGLAANSGSFTTVLLDLFGLSRDPQCLVRMKNFGTLPWWAAAELKLSLCRPVAAFTHWVDYRLYPDSPGLMHAHSVLWFAAAVWLLAIIYRKLMGPTWAAGLAAVLFLLDGNTYFPVAYVANRGFILALGFGLLCLYAHHEWRITQSRRAQLLSALCLALSLLAEESGASSLAFILAYALALDSGALWKRAMTVLPSILVIAVWRVIYVLAGYGLSHVGDFYVDPLNEPLHYFALGIPRTFVVLGGQFSSLPPEFLLAVKPALQPAAMAGYGAIAVAVVLVFLPWLRRSKMAAYWFLVMVLAAMAESCLVPVSKNLGFVAVGAYGFLASAIADWCSQSPQVQPPCAGWRAAGIACILLLLVHIPGAIAGRIITAKVVAVLFDQASRSPHRWPDTEHARVIFVSDLWPAALIYSPSIRAYHQMPLPRTIRALVPASTSLDLQRPDARTLVIQSQGPNLFASDEVGPVGLTYALSAVNQILAAPQCRPGDRYAVDGLTVEVLESDAAGLPSRVAFHFDTPLDSPEFRWLYFNWKTMSQEPLSLPAIGQRLRIPGPK